jgi:NAD+ kinase
VLRKALVDDKEIDMERLDMRMRLQVNVENGSNKKKIYKGGSFKNSEILEIKDYHVINEIVLDRGPCPFSIQLEIYIDDHYFTTMVGDG